MAVSQLNGKQSVSKDLVRKLLAELAAEGKADRTLPDIIPVSEGEILQYEAEVRLLLNNKTYDDPGFDLENPACFGNLVRYSIVRKARSGIRVKTSAHHWRRLLRDCGSWPLEPVAFRRLFDAYLSRLEGEVSARTHRKLAPNSYNNVLGCVRAAWNVAIAIELVDTNPVPAVRYPKKPIKPRKRTLTRQEIDGMKAALLVQHPGLYHAFMFCLKNPIGYGDVRRLRCQDVDLENMTVTYSRQKTDIYAAPIIYPEMVDYCRRRLHSWQYSGRPKLLFDLPKDYRWSFKHAIKRAGVTNLTWHDLRHHAATWLARQGVPLHIITSLGGWSTTEMVERYHDLKAEHAAVFARKMLVGALKEEAEVAAA